MPTDSRDAPQPLYQNPDLPLETRVADLVSRLTLEEKIAQMQHDAPAIERLGVPAYNWWNECLHGVARAGIATVFPQAIGLAATWDAPLLHRIAVAISDEARAKHHAAVRRGERSIYRGLTFWSPNINIFRDPRWGRGMETYGEDPFLTGELAVQFIHGLQGDDKTYLKLVATPKHYAVHSGPEPDRHQFNAEVSERDLWDTYLPHFQKSIVEGRADSIMCAYNRFAGDACCASHRLLDDILRQQWGFSGYVVSDCWAILDIWKHHHIAKCDAEAAALAVRAGCDLNCGEAYAHLGEAVAKGLISEAEIDMAVQRLFTARFKLGQFDPEVRVVYAQIPPEVVDCPAHREVALESARKSIVLLKNEGNLLPLSKKLRSVAVIGPNADDVGVLLGNYNGIPRAPITPLQGIRDKLGAAAQVLYAPGCDWAEKVPIFETIPATALSHEMDGERREGLLGAYFANGNFQGQPAFQRADSRLDFSWWDTTPIPGQEVGAFSIRWRGELQVPESGEYALSASGFHEFCLALDGSCIAEYKSPDHAATAHRVVSLQAGKRYPLRIEFRAGAANAEFHMLWARPRGNGSLGNYSAWHAEAVRAAEQADVAIVFLGLTPRLEGEEMPVQVPGFSGGDRTDLQFPALQEQLLQALHATGKPVVLVLLNGSALAINWADAHIPAIVEAWYPGQAGGAAIADVLFGDANPGGRLPVTFYQSVAQLPAFEDYRMANRTYRYFRGEVLYPFGHGLSYTRFAYRHLQMANEIGTSEVLPVAVELENIGDRAGDEVVQLYIRALDAGDDAPIRSLRGFRRVTLQPGEKRTVRFTLAPEDLALVDAIGWRLLRPGRYEIAVGGKQPGFHGHADANTTEVVLGRVRVVG